MFSRRNRMIGVFYTLADALLAVSSFWLAYFIRARLTTLRPLFPSVFYLWVVPLAVVLWVVVGLLAGIYRDVLEAEPRRTFADPVKVGLISTALLFALTFAFKLEYISRALLGMYAVIDLGAMVLFRLAMGHLGGSLRRTFQGFRHFLLVGDTAEALGIARAIEASEKHGMVVSGFALVSPSEIAGFRKRV